MATHGKAGFNRAIHNIENSPFRTKFERDVEEMEGNLGIGCISDFEPQPLLIQSHLGSFAITTVGKINNTEEILEKVISRSTHFFEMQTAKSTRRSLSPPSSTRRKTSSRVSATRRKLWTVRSPC